jgi:hypothetical protein
MLSVKSANLRLITILGAALAFSTSAHAATPVLAGTYLFVQETVCPVILGKTSAAGTAVTDKGDDRIQTAKLTFNASTHVAKGTAYGAETGGLAQGAGSPLVSGQRAYTVDGSYTISGDTLTFPSGGGSVTLHVTYGTVKAGIALFADLIGLESSSDVNGTGAAMCTVHATVTRL